MLITHKQQNTRWQLSIVDIYMLISLGIELYKYAALGVKS